MKLDKHILLLTLLIAAAAWVADAMIDYYFFLEGTFMETLITELSGYELYMRIVTSGSLFILGVSTSILVARLKETKQQNESLIEQLQQSLDEIETLQGILPICSYCKKIRDDEGEWDHIEVYLHKHTDTDFSHGICPSCKEDHFGGK